MRSAQTARLALGFLFVAAVTIGLTAAFAPRTFYDDFPFLAHWVELLPPYNEHLVTDVGGLYLGFAVLFGWAAWKPERALVLPLCLAWLLAAAIHLIFHVSHLGGFSSGDAIAEIAGLALLVVAPAVAIWSTAPDQGPSLPGQI